MAGCCRGTAVAALTAARPLGRQVARGVAGAFLSVPLGSSKSRARNRTRPIRRPGALRGGGKENAINCSAIRVILLADRRRHQLHEGARPRPSDCDCGSGRGFHLDKRASQSICRVRIRAVVAIAYRNTLPIVDRSRRADSYRPRISTARSTFRTAGASTDLIGMLPRSASANASNHSVFAIVASARPSRLSFVTYSSAIERNVTATVCSCFRRFFSDVGSAPFASRRFASSRAYRARANEIVGWTPSANSFCLPPNL
jgi:hypothetical protein